MDAVRERLAPRQLAWALVPVPVVGWIAAQSLTVRITAVNQGTDALVHTLATSFFAVILLISALTNAIIVTTRSPDRPKSYGPRRYPAWQIVTLLLSLGWLACIIIGNVAMGVEVVIGAAIALTSIVVFVWAVKPDRAARERRRQRLGDERAARSPEANRRRRLARVIVPAAIVVTLELHTLRLRNLRG